MCGQTSLPDLAGVPCTRVRGGVAVVLLLPIFCFVVGLSAGLAGREQFLRGASLFRGPHLFGVLIYTALVIAPIWLYLAIWYPAWSFLYWLPSVDVKLWQILLMVLTLPAAGMAGYLMTAFLSSDLRPYTAIAATAVGGALFLVLLIACLPRLGHMSDEPQWEQAGDLPGSLVAILAFAVPMIIGGFAFLLVLYEVEGQKLRRSSEMRLLVMQKTPSLPVAYNLSPHKGSAEAETHASQNQVGPNVAAKGEITVSSPLPGGETDSHPAKDPS